MNDNHSGNYGVRYEVARRFKYDGVWLEAGEPFRPTGSPNDARLINSKYVRTIQSAVEQSEQARRRGKGVPQKA